MRDKTLIGALGVGLASCVIVAIVRYVTLGALTLPKDFAEWSEPIGFVTGVVGVYLVVKEHLWNWPIGIINVLTYAWFNYFVIKHLANAGLQIVFFAYLLQGWWFWKFGGKNRQSATIGKALRWELMFALGIAVITTPILYPILLKYDGNFIFLDALTTGISLGAQFLVNRKRLENWWLWILADLIYVPLYVYRQYYLTAVLYAIFLVLSVLGLREWKSKLAAGAEGSITEP